MLFYSLPLQTPQDYLSGFKALVKVPFRTPGRCPLALFALHTARHKCAQNRHLRAVLADPRARPGRLVSKPWGQIISRAYDIADPRGQFADSAAIGLGNFRPRPAALIVVGNPVNGTSTQVSNAPERSILPVTDTELLPFLIGGLVNNFSKSKPDNAYI